MWSKSVAKRWDLLTGFLLLVFVLARSTHAVMPTRSHSLKHGWGRTNQRIWSHHQWGIIESLRAGATVEEIDVEIDEEDVEVASDDESSDDEQQDVDSDEDYDEEASSSDESEYESAVEEEEEVSVSVEEYDTQLTPPPGLQLGGLLGVMLLSKRLDMFNPKVVRFARFIFILYVIAQQAFLMYVRIQAKLTNDRTEIEVSNPLSGLVSSQLKQKQGGDMVKDLASQFLSSKTTVMEYDLKQAKSMNSGLLINMAFMWFLHFKMEQTQPLLAQTVSGVLNLVYSPLFQVYMMGRNLERPFKNPASKKLEAMAAKQAPENAPEADDSVEEVEIDVEVDEIEVESSDSDDEIEEEESDDEEDSDESDDE